MADPKGFLTHTRADLPKRPVEERLGDWDEVYAQLSTEDKKERVSTQAARCMDCGIPFCHSASTGCPLGNAIPEWNDMVRNGQWERAGERLHATNNFPEFTGKLCPAPCESGCVLALSPMAGGPVAIKQVEEAIAEIGWDHGYITPHPPSEESGHRIAVVGSGPAGLAAAQQLSRVGHAVTVYERSDRLGGLLRYGIPEFKMAKAVLDRRLAQLRSEGIRFVTGCEVGVALPVEKLRADYDAVVLAVGALRARDALALPGRDLAGVHQAMDYLTKANAECEGDGPTSISARGEHVVIIGGGDTGADCYGTAARQGALSVTQLDQYPEPPVERDDEVSPWPTWPYVLRTYPAHEETGQRRFAVAVEEFVGDDAGVRAMRLRHVRVERDAAGRRAVIPLDQRPSTVPCTLAILAIGFDGVEHSDLLNGLGLELTPKGTLGCGAGWETTTPGVFVCGDAHRGASLVVWAIAEGRSVARAVDEHLNGESGLPSPVHPTELPLAAV